MTASGHGLAARVDRRRRLLVRVLGAALTMSALAHPLACGQRVRQPAALDGISEPDIACAYEDAQGFVWFCDAYQILRFDGLNAVGVPVVWPDAFAAEEPTVHTRFRIRSLLKRDRQLLVGTERGIYIVNTMPDYPVIRPYLTRPHDHASVGAVNGFATSRDGSVWVASETGLWRLTGTDTEAPRLAPALAGTPRMKGGAVEGVVEDADGTLWLATESGLHRHHRGGVSQPVLDGASRRLAAYALAEDPRGGVIAATPLGFVRITTASTGAPAAVVTEMMRAPLQPADALAIRKLFTRGQVLREGADPAFRASVPGCHLDPRPDLLNSYQHQRLATALPGTSSPPAQGCELAVPPAPDQPATLIAELHVDRVRYAIPFDGDSPAGPVVTSALTKVVEIQLSSPHHRGWFEYRQEGIDDTWRQIKGRHLTLNVSPSSVYRLAIRTTASSSSMAAGTSRLTGFPARLEIVVPPPLWQQWWFIPLLGAMTVMTGSGVFYRMRQQRAAQVRLRTRIARDLHDSVGAGLSRIAILSEVLHQQVELKQPDSVPALIAIGTNARNVLNEMNDAVWFIDPGCETIHHLMVRLRAVATGLFETTSTTWSVDAPSRDLRHHLETEQRRHLFLFLKEALTNVARHAVASRVVIELRLTGRRLQAVVADDGIGLLQPLSRATSGGNGLRNLQARAAALGGSTTVTSAPGTRGTVVQLDIPVRPPRAVRRHTGH